MKIKVKLWGMSEMIPAFEGKEEILADFDGHQAKELILQIFSNIDSEKKRTFLDDNGEISGNLTFILNGRIVSGSNRFNRPIRGGDFIELVLAPG